MTKKYNGPFGNYAAGTSGAILNILCREYEFPLTRVENMVLCKDNLIGSSQGGPVIIRYKWIEDEVFFEFLAAHKPSLWAVDHHGIYHLRPKLLLSGDLVCFEIEADDLPYSDEHDREACFKALQHWIKVRILSNGSLNLDVDHDNMYLKVYIKPGMLISDAIRDFSYLAGFKFQSDEDARAWFNWFTPEVHTKAEQMFNVFSDAVNKQPNQNYANDFKNLERRLQLAWLETAKAELETLERNVRNNRAG